MTGRVVPTLTTLYTRELPLVLAKIYLLDGYIFYATIEICGEFTASQTNNNLTARVIDVFVARNKCLCYNQSSELVEDPCRKGLSFMEKANIKFYGGAGSDSYNQVVSLELTKNELTVVHALLSDEFEKIVSDKFRNALHTYSTDIWMLDTIIGIEKEIWNKLETPNEVRKIIQTFLDTKREWMHKHQKEIEEEKNAKV